VNVFRDAGLAPQHNRAAVDRLVPDAKPHLTSKKDASVVKHENELATQSVTSRERLRATSAENQINSS
jgi:hypothetical protein